MPTTPTPHSPRSREMKRSSCMKSGRCRPTSPSPTGLRPPTSTFPSSRSERVRRATKRSWRRTADSYVDKGQVTSEVEAFAREAAAGKTSRLDVKAVHAAVMSRITGQDSGLTLSRGRDPGAEPRQPAVAAQSLARVTRFSDARGGGEDVLHGSERPTSSPTSSCSPTSVCRRRCLAPARSRSTP